MTSELDPLAFKAALGATLARYTSTAAGVSSARAPLLSHAVEQTIAQADLVKGPFVESLPDFEKGASIKELVEDGRMHPAWSALGASESGAGLYRRPLHLHQAATIGLEENYLVATGTGSGKTESFLFPLIDSLLRDADLSQPGVRAILVYPLNALVNDQMHRIARLLFADLGDPGITLGRYTGQVRASEGRSEVANQLLQTPTFQANFPDAATVPGNWLLSREEMLKRPPHMGTSTYSDEFKRDAVQQITVCARVLALDCVGRRWNRNELFLTPIMLRAIELGRKTNPKAGRIRGAVRVRIRDGEGYGQSAFWTVLTDRGVSRVFGTGINPVVTRHAFRK